MDNNALSWAEQIEIAFAELVQKYGIDLNDNRNLANKIDAIMPDIFKMVFKADENYIKNNNNKSKLPFNDIEAMEEVLDSYLKICCMTSTLPKYNTFSQMIGINRYTLDVWHNANKSNNGYIVYLNQKETIEECNMNIICVINNSDIEYKKNMNNINIYNSGDDKLIKLTSRRYDAKKKLQEAAQNFTRNNLQTSSVGAMASANNDREIGLLWEPKNMILKNEVQNNYISASDLSSKYGIEG